MGRVNIAIIDDGVNQEVFENIVGVYHRIQISDDMQIHTEDRDHGKGYASHGTECASILCRYSEGCNIVSIRILDEVKKKCKIAKLTAALGWCLQNGIRICSLSLGSIGFREQFLLTDIIRRMVQKGIIIVASMANRAGASYPADLLGVIRVKAHEDFEKRTLISGNGRPFEPDFWAPGFQELNSINDGTYHVNGNSYAVPVVVAQIINLMWKSPDIAVNEIWRKMVYENRMPEIPPYLIGTNRDIYFSRYCPENFAKKLSQLPSCEIESPLLVITGQKRYYIASAFTAFMAVREYSGLTIDMSEQKNEAQNILWISDTDLFIRTWGYLERYFKVDFCVVCQKQLSDSMLSICDLQIDADKVVDAKNTFEEIMNILRDTSD